MESKTADKNTNAEAGTENRNFWLDAWSNAFKNFSNMFTPPAPKAETESAEGSYGAWFKPQKELLNKLMGTPELSDVFSKFFSVTNAYSDLAKMWSLILPKNEANVAPDTIKTFLNNWIENRKNSFFKLIGMPYSMGLTEVPGGVNFTEVSEIYRKSIETWLEAYGKEYKPIFENITKISQKARDLAKDGITHEDFVELYDSWFEGMDEPISKFLQIPAVGPTRQMLNKLSKSLDAYIKYCGASADFYLRMAKPSTEALEEISTQAAAILKDGEITEEKYRKFYDIIIKTFEKKFHDLLSSAGFTHSIKITLDTAMELRKSLFDIMEDNLKQTPIITRTEMDDVHKEIYLLKKKVKELNKEIVKLTENRKR
ncbi:MAG: poly(R)-hydroxyalkanoic acid synthase subunit PhaE [Planctomycetota bacterium]